MWLFFLLPIFAVFSALAFHASYSVDEIKADWPKYRCNPIYMPFAGMMSETISTSENFQYCMGQMAGEVVKLPVDGIHGLLGVVTGSLVELTSPLNLFREMFTRLRMVMMSFTSTTLGKATNYTGVFVGFLIKIRDILQRFVGQGYIASFIAYVGISFIESFVKLCITVIKGFVYAMLCLAVILALFQPGFLVLILVLASMLSAAGA